MEKFPAVDRYLCIESNMASTHTTEQGLRFNPCYLRHRGVDTRLVRHTGKKKKEIK